MKKKASKRAALKPGTFTYHGGMVFEVDNSGKARPRPDLGPNSGTFKHKHL